MSSLSKKSFNYSNINDKNKTKSNAIKIINQKNNSLKKKSCSSNNIKVSKDALNINITSNTSYISKNTNNNSNQESDIKKRNISKNTQKKTSPKKCTNNNNHLSKTTKPAKKIGTIDTYPSIISTDTLTTKNNNINKSKQNESGYLISFDFLNNRNRKDSSSYYNINNSSNIKANNKEKKNNDYNNYMRHNHNLTDLTTAEKNDAQNFSKSEQNKINSNNRLKLNVQQKNINKIQLNFNMNNNSTINEIESSRNNSASKNDKVCRKIFEPQFIIELKNKYKKKIEKDLSKKNRNSSTINLNNYSSNTTDNIYKNKNSYKIYNLLTDSSQNKITNYKTFYKNIDNNNYYFSSQSSSTFKHINSKKTNNLPKVLIPQNNVEEINEDDLDTVKLENTFISKIESVTSETYKDIQKPKNSVYFFEIPEEQNYNYIQGPIEFEYDNSLDQLTINSNKNEEVIRHNNCSKLNNINIFKIEKKSINTDDDFVNYCDNMKENDEETITNINNNKNNIVFNSISSINEKTISNNCSVSNFNLKVNNNNKFISENKPIKRNNFLDNNKNNKDEGRINCNKNNKSYRKKIIKGNFDSNKNKSSIKTSAKINHNFCQKKQKELLLYRLKNYKTKCFVDIIKKSIMKQMRKYFNMLKNNSMKMKQFIFIIEAIYSFRYKNEFFDKLSIITVDKDGKNQTTPVPNDNDSLNDNNLYSTLRNVYNKNNIFKKPILNFKSLGDNKTDSYFYVKKILNQKNTIPLTNINNIDKIDSIRNKKNSNNKRRLIPNNYKKNSFAKKIALNEHYNINCRNKIGQDEKINNIFMRKKKGYKTDINVDDKEDEVFEEAYKYKILDDERCSNGLFHRNCKADLDERQKLDLKTYFLKEVEKLEFPDTFDKNEPNEGQENVEENY